MTTVGKEHSTQLARRMASALPSLHSLESDGHNFNLAACRQISRAAASCCLMPCSQGFRISAPSGARFVFCSAVSHERSHNNTKVIARELCACAFSCLGRQRPRGIDELYRFQVDAGHKRKVLLVVSSKREKVIRKISRFRKNRKRSFWSNAWFRTENVKKIRLRHNLFLKRNIM